MTGPSRTSTQHRALALGGTAPALVSRDPRGALHVRSSEPLRPYPSRLLDRLVEGARAHPEVPFVAQRERGGPFRRLSYAQMLASTRAVASALLERGLSCERPIAILSGNGLEHLQLAFGAMWAGIPYAPISPAYSLMSRDYNRLRQVLATLTPGLVFVCEGAPYEPALRACLPDGAELVVAREALAGLPSTSFAALLDTQESALADRAFAATGPDTLVKLLFTSGSTRAPKAVQTTNRMLTSNQQMILQSLPFLAEEPPVQVDWLPWNHTFGGSHNLGVALYNGGTYYIDEGKPTPTAFAETLRNLREIAPTVYFTVPKAWEDLTVALEADAELAARFFSRVRLFMYAGAGLAQASWDRLDAVAERACGERIRMITGLGMTEASPTCTFALGPTVRSGYVGLPVPGCAMKLVSTGGKLEARFAGPHVTPGYHRNPEQTAQAFDEDGYYCTGDALKPLDEAQPELGFVFDGRLAEDFKLSTGTFVSVGPLRAKVIAEGAPYVQDVVVAGLNRSEIALLIIPRIDDCRRLLDAGRLVEGAASTSAHEIVHSPAVRAWFQALVDRVERSATGSAQRVARAHVLAEPLSIDDGEVTDKNSVNQSAVLTRRAALIDALYAGTDPHLIVPTAPPTSR